MLLQRFYDDTLAQASYLVGCAATGEAIVVDPNRDAEQYLAAARAERLRITHVTETHIHADFVSGSRELARRAGARLLLSAEGGADWRYAFAEEDGATLLRDGDTFMVGNVRFDVMHTPGHTPEHLSFVVTDTAGATEPMGIFTGDFVFVGDVGRPDLLERAAGWRGTMDASARTLHHSLRRFAALPDWMQLWPGHGAGTACGKSLGGVPSSTVGYERRFNWAFGAASEDEFVRQVLAGQPDPPRYFAQMKRINREGPRVLGAIGTPRQVAAERLRELLENEAIVLDTRPAAPYARGHVPGTLNLPLGRSFTNWAGWLLPYGRDLWVIAADERAAAVAVRDLALIGLDRVPGWFGPEVDAAWTAKGQRMQAVPQVTPAELAPRLAAGTATVLDVRTSDEWNAGHLPGVVHIPLGTLPDRLAELPRDRPIVLHCQRGGRSSIAASLLQARGFTHVENLAGGFSAWRDEGQPVERAEGAPASGA
jgi:hydroxyacylglutathione hydrolase